MRAHSRIIEWLEGLAWIEGGRGENGGIALAALIKVGDASVWFCVACLLTV